MDGDDPHNTGALDARVITTVREMVRTKLQQLAAGVVRDVLEPPEVVVSVDPGNISVMLSKAPQLCMLREVSRVAERIQRPGVEELFRKPKFGERAIDAFLGEGALDRRMPWQGVVVARASVRVFPSPARVEGRASRKRLDAAGDRYRYHVGRAGIRPRPPRPRPPGK